MDEHVLVIPASALFRTGDWFGLTLDIERVLPQLLDEVSLTFRPRSEVETDPSFKQLIPYAVLLFGDHVFVYRRGERGGERRLHHQWSLGIGGHVSRVDGHAGKDAYRNGFLRELDEEVAIRTSFEDQILGLVYDPRTPVGEVHVGVVHLISLGTPEVTPRDPSMLDGHFMPISQLAERIDQFESWSQFVAEPLATRVISPSSF